jgi:hypothetical protein
MTTICSFCGRTLEEKEGETFCICEYCHKFTPKGSSSFKPIQKEVKKMSDLSKWGKLKCSVCNQEKFATQDRIEKWKDKAYVCRDCKKKLNGNKINS